MSRKKFFLVMVLVGAIVPWTIFGMYLLNNEFSLAVFFANGAITSIVVELIILNLTFIVWSYLDAAKHGIRRWWLVAMLSYVCGCAVPLPLYILFRIRAFEGRAKVKFTELSKQVEVE